MRLLAARNSGRGLSGFGHLPQYTPITSEPGFSCYRDVPNHFVRFNSSPNKFVRKDREESNTRGG